ncbi:hypothetical protein IHE44_0014590, partial [Lamprotornis superbus]
MLKYKKGPYIPGNHLFCQDMKFNEESCSVEQGFKKEPICAVLSKPTALPWLLRAGLQVPDIPAAPSASNTCKWLAELNRMIWCGSILKCVCWSFAVQPVYSPSPWVAVLVFSSTAKTRCCMTTVGFVLCVYMEIAHCVIRCVCLAAEDDDEVEVGFSKEVFSSGKWQQQLAQETSLALASCAPPMKCRLSGNLLPAPDDFCSPRWALRGLAAPGAGVSRARVAPARAGQMLVLVLLP